MTTPSKTRTSGNFSAVGAAVLFWLYTVFLLVMEVSETCTMGGEGHLPTLMIGGPVAMFSVVLLYRSSRTENTPFDSRLALTPALAILLLYHLPQVFSVTILGHHSCGSSFDSYLEYTRSIERWIPLIFLSIVLLAGWATWRPYLRRTAV